MPSYSNDDLPSHGGKAPDPDDRRQHLEREESTTSYPIIGDGYSDTISVVSDITTPTVMPGQVVPLEEHYAGPPMQIDFSRRVNKSRSRPQSFTETPRQQPQQPQNQPVYKQPEKTNSAPPTAPASTLVPTSAVTPLIKTAGGAAAKRRQNYIITMAQLEAGRNSLSSTTPSTGSLLGKSSQYAASVSATAASMKNLSLQNQNQDKAPPAAKEKRQESGGFGNFNAIVVTTKKPSSNVGTGNMFDNDGFPNPSGFGGLNGNNSTTSSTSTGRAVRDDFFLFGSSGGVDKSNGGAKMMNATGSTAFGNNTGLFDQDGFPMSIGGAVSDDLFAISSFDNDFRQDTFMDSTATLKTAETTSSFGKSSSSIGSGGSGDGSAGHLPASTRDSAKKKKSSNRRSSATSSTSTKSPTMEMISKSKKKDSDATPNKSDEKTRKKRDSTW